MKFKLFLAAVVLIVVALPTFAQSQVFMDQVRAILDGGTAKSLTVVFTNSNMFTEGPYWNTSQLPILTIDDPKKARKAAVDISGARGFIFVPKEGALTIFF